MSSKTSLPQVFLKFQRDCRWSLPEWVIGTDVTLDEMGFNKDAAELLSECNCNLKLDSQDFVFMMHQGYMFWFFQLNGEENPEVFGYHEGQTEFTSLGKLKQFLVRPHN